VVVRTHHSTYMWTGSFVGGQSVNIPLKELNLGFCVEELEGATGVSHSIQRWLHPSHARGRSPSVLVFPPNSNTLGLGSHRWEAEEDLFAPAATASAECAPEETAQATRLHRALAAANVLRNLSLQVLRCAHNASLSSLPPQLVSHSPLSHSPLSSLSSLSPLRVPQEGGLLGGSGRLVSLFTHALYRCHALEPDLLQTLVETFAQVGDLAATGFPLPVYKNCDAVIQGPVTRIQVTVVPLLLILGFIVIRMVFKIQSKYAEVLLTPKHFQAAL
jgi:hypothetical protein